MSDAFWEPINRAGWGPGPWDNEPDRVEWIDRTSGFVCFIMRSWTGSLNGYVALPPDHPSYKKGYDSIDADCHGGLTFASMSKTRDEDADGEYELALAPDEHFWVIGFDCNHWRDYAPGMSMGGRAPTFEIYRTWEYVHEQVRQLAWQMYNDPAYIPTQWQAQSSGEEQSAVINCVLPGEQKLLNIEQRFEVLLLALEEDEKTGPRTHTRKKRTL